LAEHRRILAEVIAIQVQAGKALEITGGITTLGARNAGAIVENLQELIEILKKISIHHLSTKRILILKVSHI